MGNWNACVALVSPGRARGCSIRRREASGELPTGHQDLGAFAQGISKAVSAEDYDAIAKYAASAKDAFGIVEANHRRVRLSNRPRVKDEMWLATEH
jgi:hypothetical protein